MKQRTYLFLKIQKTFSFCLCISLFLYFSSPVIAENRAPSKLEPIEKSLPYRNHCLWAINEMAWFVKINLVIQSIRLLISENYYWRYGYERYAWPQKKRSWTEDIKKNFFFNAKLTGLLYGIEFFSRQSIRSHFFSEADQNFEKILYEQSQTEHLIPVPLKKSAQKIFYQLLEQSFILYPNTRQYPWQLAIIYENTKNAFAFCNGKIVFFTGMANICDSEDQIAGILGHEIGHVLAQHVINQLYYSTFITYSTILLRGIFNIHRDIFDIHVDLLSATGTFLTSSYSRTHETEADTIGSILAARAGYHPKAIVELWEKWSQSDSESTLNSFFATHPLSKKRAGHLKKIMPQLMTIYNRKR